MKWLNFHQALGSLVFLVGWWCTSSLSNFLAFSSNRDWNIRVADSQILNSLSSWSVDSPALPVSRSVLRGICLEVQTAESKQETSALSLPAFIFLSLMLSDFLKNPILEGSWCDSGERCSLQLPSTLHRKESQKEKTFYGLFPPSFSTPLCHSMSLPQTGFFHFSWTKKKLSSLLMVVFTYLLCLNLLAKARPLSRKQFSHVFIIFLTFTSWGLFASSPVSQKQVHVGRCTALCHGLTAPHTWAAESNICCYNAWSAFNLSYWCMLIFWPCYSETTSWVDGSNWDVDL